MTMTAIPTKPAVHPSHWMVLGNTGARYCYNCERCACHRKTSLGMTCPAMEFPGVKTLEENTNE